MPANVTDIILKNIADRIKEVLPPGATRITRSKGPPEAIKIRFLPPVSPGPAPKPIFAFNLSDYDFLKTMDGINLIIEAPSNNTHYYRYLIYTRTAPHDIDPNANDFIPRLNTIMTALASL